MASKRVSLKGKGADLFFGDYAPPTATPDEAAVSGGADAPSPPAGLSPSAIAATPGSPAPTGEVFLGGGVTQAPRPSTKRPRTPPERTNGRTNEPRDERTDERMEDRARVRHSFDIWRDQLVALNELQHRIFTATGRKPKLGELVQEALDAYIGNANQHERSNVRTNGRSR